MRLLALVFTTTFLVVSAPDAFAQKAKLGKIWHTDASHGYRFKYPDDWKDIPRDQPPVIAQIDGPSVSTKVDGNAAYQVSTQLKVFVFKQKAAVTREDEEGSGGLKDLVDSEAGGRQKIGEDSLEKVFGELLEFKEVESDEGKTKSKIAFERKVFEAGYNTGQVSFQMAFDTYTYHLDDFDIVLVYALPESILSKWGKVLLGTAKTFEEIERKRIAEVTDHTDYEQVLAAAKAEVETTAGWEVLEVPSKRYIVKTSSTDKKFLKDLLPRLEKSRDLFERDFPPSAPIEHISIVRVCKDYDEFTSYGQVPNGVVGFFSPSSTELVIVDLKSIDRNITWSTVTHEAFHQYCHFLFDESEAHRWFDEGHGDYYGFFEFKGKKAKAEYKRGGESRLAEIKPWIKSGNYTPISKLLKLNHPQWQAQYLHYSQSWALIWMLRQGAEGKVPRKYWRPEYADIVPTYVRTLHEGFLRAYDDIREERNLKPGDKVNRFMLSTDAKEEIWKKAIDAAWGAIDMEEFEEKWVGYITKGVR